MEVLTDLEPTKHIRLKANEYLILHTPKGTLDIDVKNGLLDLGDKASANYSITRYKDFKIQPVIQPITTERAKKKRARGSMSIGELPS